MDARPWGLEGVRARPQVPLFAAGGPESLRVQALETAVGVRIFPPWARPPARKFQRRDPMANLTRYNPFDETFDDLFKGFFVRPMTFDNQQPVQIKVDVKEEEGAYVVYADIPGVKKEDIHVTVDGNQVAISTEMNRSREEKQGDKLVHVERYSGKAYRAFSLAQEVDETQAQARYTDGVLELRLPKKAQASARKLSIQ
jgi:HSP20 family protein